MSKITKHAEFMDTLHSMITKEATAGKATGKPGADTHYESVGSEHDHVDKNKEGHPEHNPQEFKQEKGKDGPLHGKAAEADPVIEATKAAEATKEAELTLPATGKGPVAKDAPAACTQTESPKVASDNTSTPNEKLAQLGQQLLETIQEMQKEGTAGKATGKPGADTHYESVKGHDEINKNKEGHPEHNPQEFKQEKGKDGPLHGKSAEELDLDKEASYALGRQFARAFLSTKTAASVDTGVYKEAGRRDFEALIAQASSELENEGRQQAPAPRTLPAKTASAPIAQAVHYEEAQDEEVQIKQAEEAGAQAFYTLLKQAQEEEQANQIKLAFDQRVQALEQEKNAAEKRATDLATKLAERDAEMQKKAEDEKLDAKFASFGGRIVEEVISRLKHTAAE